MEGMPTPAVRGRGTAENPKNRFEEIEVVPDLEAPEDERPAPHTRFFRDLSRSIIATNDSPDVGFSASVNPYRGCEHGCVYCYARPTHEYLGLSAGLDFETHILVKEDAPELLDKALRAPGWRAETVAIGAVTDPYQPVERRLRITRGCLGVLAKFRNPCAVITKSGLVTADIDLLRELAEHDAAVLNVSITSLDDEIRRLMEPRASPPHERLR